MAGLAWLTCHDCLFETAGTRVDGISNGVVHQHCWMVKPLFGGYKHSMEFT
jgi:hypothetical protein